MPIFGTSILDFLVSYETCKETLADAYQLQQI